MSDARIGAVSQQLRQLAGVPASDLTDEQLVERFVASRDEAVFAALVARHGPMVLNVCRRLLGNLHDADDAFQAVFALLAVKAAALRNRQALGPWLHTAAVRIAGRARDRARRQGHLERQVLDMIQPEAAATPRWQDVQPVVDEEIERLPAKYRDPVVLRYLEGKNTEQSARALNCPQGSLTWRLSRALELLRERLTRRGIALSAAMLASLLEANALQAAVPAALAADATRTALLFSGGQQAAVSANIVTLIEGALRTMMISKLKWAGLFGLAASVLAVVGFGLAPAFVPQDVGEKKGTPPAAKGKTEPAGVPLEARLIAKVKNYKIELTDKEIERLGKPANNNGNNLGNFEDVPAAARVDLVFEIKNVGDKDVEIWGSGDPVKLSLALAGPGAVTVVPQNRGKGGLFTPPRPLTIAKGATHSLPIASLDEFVQVHYWTKPGEYTLTAKFQTALLPAPQGSRIAPEHIVPFEQAADPTKNVRLGPPRKLAGFGEVMLFSAPTAVTVTK